MSIKATALENVLSTYENEEKTGKGMWLGTPEVSLGLEINVNKDHEYAGFSVHNNKHNKLAHGICLYVNGEGQPMLQASDNTRVENINLLDMIAYIKQHLPSKKEE